MERGIRKAVAVAGLLMFIGCGPMYSTDYVFTPPRSSEGKFCINQCEQNRYHCRDSEDMRVQNCEVRSDIDEERCRQQILWDKGREPKWYECGGELCSADYERCDSLYRSCYQGCGGEVTSETRCVANCDQVPPTQGRGR